MDIVGNLEMEMEPKKSGEKKSTIIARSARLVIAGIGVFYGLWFLGLFGENLFNRESLFGTMFSWVFGITLIYFSLFSIFREFRKLPDSDGSE